MTPHDIWVLNEGIIDKWSRKAPQPLAETYFYMVKIGVDTNIPPEHAQMIVAECEYKRLVGHGFDVSEKMHWMKTLGYGKEPSIQDKDKMQQVIENPPKSFGIFLAEHHYNIRQLITADAKDTPQLPPLKKL